MSRRDSDDSHEGIIKSGGIGETRGSRDTGHREVRLRQEIGRAANPASLDILSGRVAKRLGKLSLKRAARIRTLIDDIAHLDGTVAVGSDVTYGQSHVRIINFEIIR